MRRRLGDIVTEVARDSGAKPGELWAFFASGLLLNATAALEPGANDHDTGCEISPTAWPLSAPFSSDRAAGQADT